MPPEVISALRRETTVIPPRPAEARKELRANQDKEHRSTPEAAGPLGQRQTRLPKKLHQ